MRALVFLMLVLISVARAHEGHDHGAEPGAIKNGKLIGKDSLVYLDAGPQIEWAGQKLKRKISELNQVVYKFSEELKEDKNLSSGQDKFLELKVPGAEILKAFSFDHAGELRDPIEINSPDFSNDVIVSKNKPLALRWKADPTSSLVKIIIEVYSATGKLIGRVSVSTKDDGEYDLPAKLLNQLPLGEGKIALKRIWFGEFQPDKDKSDMIGVKSAMSVVGRSKVSDF